MAGNTKRLKEAGGGIYAPQHYNAEVDDYEYAQGADGAAFVTIKNPQKEVTFASATNTAGSKVYVDKEKRSITVEFFGSVPAATATFTAWAVRGTRKYLIQGVKVAGGEIDLVGIGSEDTTLIKPGMVVEFDKPAGSDFEIQWTAPTGGTVSAIGTIV